MGKWGQWDWKKMGMSSKIVPFSPIFLLFPINVTHLLYISQNVFLAISHNFPFFSISPHFPPSFHFPHFSKPLRLGG